MGLRWAGVNLNLRARASPHEPWKLARTHPSALIRAFDASTFHYQS